LREKAHSRQPPFNVDLPSSRSCSVEGLRPTHEGTFDFEHWRKKFKDWHTNLAMEIRFMRSQNISMSLCCDLPEVDWLSSRSYSVEGLRRLRHEDTFDLECWRKNFNDRHINLAMKMHFM
jgi:hypothetical protein